MVFEKKCRITWVYIFCFGSTFNTISYSGVQNDMGRASSGYAKSCTLLISYYLFQNPSIILRLQGGVIYWTTPLLETPMCFWSQHKLKNICQCN